MLPPIVPPSRRKEDLVLQVEEAAGSGRKQLISFPYHLYRGDHRWIPPFGSARLDALRPQRNVLLRGGQSSAFVGIARNLGLGDETMGVLAAWSTQGAPDDEAGAWGRWGCFDALNVEELADRLFFEAETWLFEHAAGIAGIRGPCSPEPLVAPGLLTDGFDAQPIAFLPYNLPYYPEMVEAQGYEPAATWHAYALPLPAPAHRAGAPPSIRAATWAEVAGAYATRDRVAGDREALVPGLVQWLDHLAGGVEFGFNRRWQSAVGKTFRRAIAVAPGQDAACFGIPDIGPALRLSRGRQFPLGWLLFEIGRRHSRRLHVFPAAIPSEYRAEQLAQLYGAVAEAAAAAGYRQVDIAPVSDDDERSLEALSAIGAQPRQQFTIFEKSF
jgi:hypothetical protein